jgi:hypothetical protein
MKRYLVACALAVTLVAMADQQASAWSKANFSVGLTYNREASENNFFWGLFRNGPHPYASANSGYGYGGYGGNGGYATGGYYTPGPAVGSPLPTLPAPGQSAPISPTNQSSTPTQQIGYYNYNYQAYPTTGYYSVPSYWYNN